jgi:predicted small lipoprotein YifL
MRLKNALIALSMLSTLSACGSSRTGGFEAPPPAKEDTSDSGGGGGGEPSLGEAKPVPMIPVSISGTVYAPNGTLPMANTLVYVTSKEPEPIPQGVYCDQCVTLAAGTFAMSASDGSVEIATELPAGDAWVVVQKGQFRRVRKVTIEEDAPLELSKKDLTLPGEADPATGDTVPKMVVLKDSMDFDQIDESLKKLGITDFEVRNNRNLLDDEDKLMKYQIVFIPCGMDDDPRSASSPSKDNLQKFVAAGGKLYVTDWSYEFVRQPFPGYVSWAQETSTLGSAATGDEWDAPATAQDQGLGDWLAATGETSFTVEGNWTTITSVNTVQGLDPEGQPADITPKVWVTGKKSNGTFPTTVSFENQCGRVLFSTYHTENHFTGSKIFAQEKALLYVLLEVGVCVGPQSGVD